MNIEILTYDASKEDPKKVILDRVSAAVEKIELGGNKILIAVAPQPTVTRGGIIRPDSNRDEQRWQGKVGLVLKLGKTACKYAFDFSQYEWEGLDLKPGDWVFFQKSDARERGIAGIPCATIKDYMIEGRIPDPELVW
jgi:co-chaperonin GroES (HSP10)